MKTTKKKIVDQLIAKSFLTGSRKYNVAFPSSDFDYVLMSDDFNEIADSLSASNVHFIWDDGYEDRDEFRSFKITIDGVFYNFIVVYHKDDFLAWRHATSMMMSIPRKMILAKKTRLQIFQKCKDIYYLYSDFKRGDIKDARKKESELFDDDVPF